jgi:D-alanyl-D-alanine carboxypeptidase
VIPTTHAAAEANAADAKLDRALEALVEAEGGPPGIVVAVQRNDEFALHTAGVTDLATGATPQTDDHVRLASVAKAFSGAAALAVVAQGKLSLDDTIGETLPDLPRAWASVTLAQLLGHTSGIPDFSKSPAFREALGASLLVPPPPASLLAFVADDSLDFRPGARYHYSNSDNIAVGLMVEAATGMTYESVLQDSVFGPLALASSSLPSDQIIPAPYVHGYAVEPPAAPEDISELFAAGWTWASGGIVSTPGDATRFVRGYASGATTDAATHTAQFEFVKGRKSEPPGPGTNAAGLAIFRYQMRCGTVYGHTGNTPGYTAFVAATSDGARSATVSVNSQITPSTDPERFPALRKIFGLAVCAALSQP